MHKAAYKPCKVEALVKAALAAPEGCVWKSGGWASSSKAISICCPTGVGCCFGVLRRVIYTYLYIHTYIHIYIHTYIHVSVYV